MNKYAQNLFLSLLIVFFSSCIKEEKIVIVPFGEKARLQFRVLGEEGKGIANVELKIFEIFNSDYVFNTPPLIVKSTDANGYVDFGEMDASTYRLLIDDVVVGGVEYSPRYNFQVIAGNDRVFDIKVDSFSGRYNMAAFLLDNARPNGVIGATNYRIIVLNADDYLFRSRYLTAQHEKDAVFHKQADISGENVFKLPSDRGYYFIIYRPETKKIYYEMGASIERYQYVENGFVTSF